MSVISRIESMMEDYSSAEKKLANYIIGNIEKVPTMTANELAEASGLSAPTVVRFSKKIGFQSLTDFKITISTELQTGIDEGFSDIEANESFYSIKNKLGNNAQVAIKETVDIPIQLHTHYTSGVASMTYMKAVEAGCDIIDTAISPFSMGTSQPATEVMVEAFKGTEFDTGLDQNLLAEIADYFRPMREEALESGLMNTKVLGVNIKTLLYQVPGGMLSNMVSQLKEQHAEDKYEEVLKEIPRVRKDLGEPPLVTPSSQIVGTQAVFNVLMGERYKVATKETKDVLLGKYGQTVKPFNPEVVDKVLGEDKKNAITCRYADLLEPELDKIEAEMKQWKQQDEDVLTYALFPQVATDFFKYREAQQKKVDATIADTKNGAYPV
mgnify:CR=1 FL=1